MRPAIGPPPPSPAPPATAGLRRVLVLRNLHGELRRLAAWVAAVARENGLSVKATFKLDICLAEAVANVIEHGLPEDGAHEIRVSAEPRGPEMVLAVDDDGLAFDPLQAPPKAAALEQFRIGGYGLRLLRHFADSCRYERRQGRNILTITVRATG